MSEGEGADFGGFGGEDGRGLKYYCPVWRAVPAMEVLPL
jgi:hypothetical protein